MRVLLVEDSARLRDSVAKALRRSGYAVAAKACCLAEAGEAGGKACCAKEAGREAGKQCCGACEACKGNGAGPGPGHGGPHGKGRGMGKGKGPGPGRP